MLEVFRDCLSETGIPLIVMATMWLYKRFVYEPRCWREYVEARRRYTEQRLEAIRRCEI